MQKAMAMGQGKTAMDKQKKDTLTETQVEQQHIKHISEEKIDYTIAYKNVTAPGKVTQQAMQAQHPTVAGKTQKEDPTNIREDYLNCVQTNYGRKIDYAKGKEEWANKKAIEAKEVTISKKYGAGAHIVISFRLDQDGKKFALAGAVAVYDDATGKQLNTALIGQKKNGDTIWDDAPKLSPEELLTALPDMITAFAKKCVDEIKTQIK
jgi:hypothetical protein